jgi:aminoglycoside phosphotransferase (APT) family kinase protein
VNLRELGIPDESEFIATYCRHAGRTHIDNWPFFLAFSCFRMAAITQGRVRARLAGQRSRSACAHLRRHRETVCCDRPEAGRAAN